MASPAERRPQSRRYLFAILLCVLLLGVLELVSFGGMWIVDGQVFSPARLQQARAEATLDFGRDRPDDETASRDVPHPYLGFVRNPDVLPTVSQFGYPKSTPLFTQRAEDRVVVAVVGGSVAFHFAKAGLPAVIEGLGRDAAWEDKEFVVANLAVGGYKQPQQLMTLSYLLSLGFEFDVVINIDGFNEVALHQAENAPRHVFPVYPRNWYGRVSDVPDSELRMRMGRVAWIEDRIVSWAVRFSRAPWRFSPTANLVWRLRHEKLVQEQWEAVESFRRFEPSTSPYASTGPRVAFSSEDDVYEHLAAIWQRSSLQLDRLCRANGIRYYHFLQPNQYVPDSKPLNAEERREAFRDDHPYRAGAEQGYPFLEREGGKLVEAGVRFVDLTHVFDDEDRTVYIDTCCHVNELGNLTLSQRVLETIRGDG